MMPVRRESIWLLICVGIVGCSMTGRAVFGEQQKNVLFIAVDDLRPELGCYGDRDVISPNIDKLAARGMVFDRAYCQQAVCNASRASLLTGLRPDTLKVWDLRTDFRTTRPKSVTLPQCFKQQGYHTVAIGKIFHNTLPDPVSWSEPKWNVEGYPFDPDAVYRSPASLAWLDQRRQTLVQQGDAQRHIDRFGKWYLKAHATEAIDVADNAYFDGAQTDHVIAQLDRLKQNGSPFFLAIGYYRPHLPFNVPKRYWDLYRRESIRLADPGTLSPQAPTMAINTMRELRGYVDFRQAPRPDEGPLDESQARLLKHGYLASVSYIDAQIGRLWQALEQRELTDNTIVVLWGDHGWKLGEHQSWCKMTNYEIDTRVPLLVVAPNADHPGRSCRRLVEFVDVYPTLCQLAGIAAPAELEGTSLVPLLNNPDRPWKSAAFSQFLREGVWAAPDGVEYMGYAVRTERYRYVEWRRWDDSRLVARELYDHQDDPAEQLNRIDDRRLAATVERLQAMLIAGWKDARPKAD